MTAKPALQSQKKAKKYMEHGQDSLGLAVAIANSQEEKTQRKTQRLHQPQPGQPRPQLQSKKRSTAGRKDKLKEAKATIVKHQAELKKEKVKARKEQQRSARNSKRDGDDQARCAHPATDAGAPVGSERTANSEKKRSRKKVSFA